MWLHNSFMMIIMSCLHDFWYYVLVYETTSMSWFMILQATTHIVDYHNKCNVVGTPSCCYNVFLNKGSILHWSCIRAVAWTQTPDDCITALRIKRSPCIPCSGTQGPPTLSHVHVMHVYVKWSWCWCDACFTTKNDHISNLTACFLFLSISKVESNVHCQPHFPAHIFGYHESWSAI